MIGTPLIVSSIFVWVMLQSGMNCRLTFRLSFEEETVYREVFIEPVERHHLDHDLVFFFIGSHWDELVSKCHKLIISIAKRSELVVVAFC